MLSASHHNQCLGIGCQEAAHKIIVRVSAVYTLPAIERLVIRALRSPLVLKFKIGVNAFSLLAQGANLLMRFLEARITA